MRRKVFACIFFVLMLASAASAKTSLWSNYISTAKLTSGGKSDYSSAKFLHLYLEIEDDKVTATQEHLKVEGKITISGGKYFVTDGKGNILQTVSDKPMTFRLVSNMKVREGLCYVPKIEKKRIYFVPEEEKSLNGVKVSWEFPDMPELNGSSILPNFKTTSEQLASGVPYIELNVKGDTIPSFYLRLVKAQKTSQAVSPKFPTTTRTFFRYSNNEDARTDKGSYPGRYGLKQRYTWPVPQTLEGLERIDFRIYTQDADSNSCVYQWNFEIPSSFFKKHGRKK